MRSEELQIGLGIYGFLATGLAFAGLNPTTLAWASLLFVLLFYMAALMVHAGRSARTLTFLHDGAIAGVGYLESFRTVKRCLYLMHLDDDPPGEELQALYKTLLARGVQIRRTVFLRPDADPSAYSWIVRFGNHPNLHQRVVLPEGAAAMRFSFVIVDDSVVLLSVPGAEPIDHQPYTSQLILRHLLRIEDRDVARAFLQVHQDLWERALPLQHIGALAHLGIPRVRPG